MQTLGGSSYGKAISAFNSAIVGGIGKHAALAQFLDLGLLKDEDVIYNKQGDVKGIKPGHHIAGWRLAQTNPYAWTGQYLEPAMEKKGVKDWMDQAAMVPSLFQNTIAAQLVTEMMTQRSRIDKDRAMWRAAQGLEAAPRLSHEDPTIVYQGLKESLTSLGGTIAQSTVKEWSAPIAEFSQAVARFDADIQRLGGVWDALNERGAKRVAEDPRYDWMRRADDWLTWKHGGDVTGLRQWAPPVVNYGVVQHLNPQLNLQTSGLPLDRIANPWYDQQGRYMAGPMVPSLDYRKPENVKLEGSADIKVSVELAAAEEWIVGKIREVVSAQGALRADTGRSMPEASPGAWSGQ